MKERITHNSSISPNRPKMSTRRKARENALQLLFQWDSLKDLENTLPSEMFYPKIQKEKMNDFTQILFEGVIQHHDEIDQIINESTEHWSLGRMSRVDRNILRFSIYEFLYQDDIPIKVTMNEAIEIAKRFGSRESGKFINGVLDQILKKDERISKKLKGQSIKGLENLK